MAWVWAAVVVWVLLAVPAAILLGRTIHRADRRELELPSEPPAPLAPPRNRECPHPTH